jgi:hypothetical protein
VADAGTPSQRQERIMTIRSLVHFFACALAVGFASSAAAQTLDLTLVDPSQSVQQGTVAVEFDAIVTNASAQTVFLNGDSATTGSPLLTIDDSPFFANAPLSLDPGQSSGLFALFNLDLDPSATPGVYDGNVFSLLGGADGGATVDVADAAFSLTVTPSAPPVPEPGMLACSLIGLAALTVRRRASHPGQVRS